MSTEKYPLIHNWLDVHLNHTGGTAIPGLQVAINENGEESFSGSYGKADVENDVPLTDDHAMPCGSLTKSLAVIEILRAVEAGELSLDAVPSDLLPIAARNVGKVALGKLISHTSGLPVELSIPGVYVGPDPAQRTVEPEEFFEVLGDMPLKFEPGSAQAYSNSGIALGVFMLESATGKSFSSLAKENIFEPLTMTCSGIETTERPAPKVYSYISGKACDSDIVPLGVYSHSSGLTSNAKDLAKLGTVFLGKHPEVISPESLRYMRELPSAADKSTAGRGVFVRSDGVALYGLRSFCTTRVRVNDITKKVTAVTSNCNDTMKVGSFHQGIDTLSDFLRENECDPVVTTYTDGHREVQQVAHLQDGSIVTIEPMQEHPVPLVWRRPSEKPYFEHFSGQGHRVIVLTDTELQGERVVLRAMEYDKGGQ